MSVPFSPDQFTEAGALPVKRIPLADVRPSQHESTMNLAKVERMRKTWSRSMDEPIVAERDGKYTVLDGHHRVLAARQRGHKYLRARISE